MLPETNMIGCFINSLGTTNADLFIANPTFMLYSRLPAQKSTKMFKTLNNEIA